MLLRSHTSLKCYSQIGIAIAEKNGTQESYPEKDFPERSLRPKPRSRRKKSDADEHAHPHKK